MLEGLCRMTWASVGISAILDVNSGPESNGNGNPLTPLLRVYTGCGQDEATAAANEYLRTLLPADPAHAPMMRLLAHRACEPTTRRRAQLIDDRPWYASRHFQEVRRPMRIDDALYSMHPIRGTSLLTALILNRPFGRRRPFESR